MPDARYFIKASGGTWFEVDLDRWCHHERGAGFHPKGGSGPATGGFSGMSVEGRIVYSSNSPDQYDWDPEFRDAVWPG